MRKFRRWKKLGTSDVYSYLTNLWEGNSVEKKERNMREKKSK